MIAKVIESQKEPAILVGHSLGGVVISEVSNRMPASIEELVYLSAFMLGPNQTIHQIIAVLFTTTFWSFPREFSSLTASSS